MLEQSLLDSIAFGVVITDRALQVSAINRWVFEQRDLALSDCLGLRLTELFPEIQERGLQSIYELVLESEQRITISNRIHKYFLKMPGRRDAGLDYMPQAAIVSPLFVGQELSGTLTVISDVSDRVIVEGILNREIDKLSTLHRLDVALATLDLQACLREIATQTRTHFAAEGTAVFLAEGEQLGLAAGMEMPGEGMAPPANSLAAWCFDQHQPRLLNYELRAEPFAPLLPSADTELAAPLLLGETCIGVIQVCLSRTRVYDRYDLELLQALATRAATAIENARLHAASEYWRSYHERVNARLQTLLTVTRLMSSPLVLRKNLEAVTELLLRVFQAEVVVLLKQRPGSDHLLPFSALGISAQELENCLIDRAAAQQAFAPEEKSKTCLDLGQVSFLPDGCRQALLSAGLCRLMYAGLSVRNSFAGLVLVFSSNARREFNAEEQELFEAIATQLSLALENAELYAQQEKLAVTDGLTGVSNRRRFDQELELWLKRSHRSNTPTSLIMVDIDNFKRFNDTFGHQAGDEVLKLLAELVVENVREVDIVARYGGEEFVVILPSTGLPEAVLVAERIRMTTQGLLTRATNPRISQEVLTISLGVAAAPLHASEPPALLRAADGFLYEAKRSGKNRVVTSEIP